MQETWISVSDAGFIFGVSKQYVLKCIGKKKYLARESHSRQRGGKAGISYEIALSSLPLAVQAKYKAEYGVIEEARIDRFLPPMADDKSADQCVPDWDRFIRLPGTVQRKAWAQSEAVVELKRLIDGNKALYLYGADKLPLERLFAQVVAAYPICKSVATLKNWWYGKPGKPGCVNFEVKDYAAVLAGAYKGRVAKAECSEAAYTYYRGLYLHRRAPTRADCYARVLDKAKQEGWIVPSEPTLFRRLEAEVSPATITLMREGEEALRKLTPFVERDKTVFRAGEAVSGDGLKFDKLWVKFPDGEIINTATAWFWQDIYSGKIVAWRMGKTESTDLFRLATYDLTGHFVPKYTQVDNTRVAANKMMTGQMEIRRRFGNQPKDPQGLLVMLEMGPVFTDPDHSISSPGSKPVERAFGIGGLHSKVANNPTIRDRGYSQKTAITSEELKDVIGYEVVRHNAQEKRRSPVCGGVLSFNQAFEQSFMSYAPRKLAESQRRLLLLALEVARTASNNGSIRIKAGKSQYGSNRYWCEKLNEYRGEDVTVFYDPEDLTQDVDIYSLDGKFICTANHMAGVGFTDKESGAEYSKRAHRVKKLAKLQAKEIAAIQKLHNSGKLPEVEQPQTPESKVVEAMFKKPWAQAEAFEGEGEIYDMQALFSKAMKGFG